ncbi:hypothetical protein RMSM_04108 [Rhodopirellula maiorica SM1]|uniref:Uncharacterized protein n=1 Tax=Rhodopirellula maiorica SM1 TaxID=1265738 RepID=M5RI53_9BACT|nr:hypothetical protein RMSM_04108 [Rhodopirellula maiorica SM1]
MPNFVLRFFHSNNINSAHFLHHRGCEIGRKVIRVLTPRLLVQVRLQARQRKQSEDSPLT